MAVYVVSYDLRRDETREDYERVYNVLKTAANWCWALKSVWIIETSSLPSQIIQILLNAGALDDNDGIVVLELTGIGDFRRIPPGGAVEWLNTKLIRL